MNTDGTVVIEKLVKDYAGGVRAVDGIDVTVSSGEFFGFLGPNGAGKTTTMKVLSTLLRKSSGRAVVAGFDVDKDPDGVRRSIGFAMQEVGLDDLASGRDFLRLQGALYGLSRRDARLRTDEVLELVGLTSVAGRKVGTYSGGMRRRIDLAAALMHSPPVLFLDEPTTGLDPQSRLAVWEHLTTLNGRGVTIFLTTQMMEEAERLCQRLAIIDRGGIVAEGSPKSLKADVGGDVVQVTISPPVDGPVDSDVARARDLLSRRPYVSSVTGIADAISVATTDGGAAVPDVVGVLRENDISITDLSVVSPTLDDVFLKHTGRSIRDEDVSSGEADQATRQMLGLGDRR